MTNGTARIETQGNGFRVDYMTVGNFTIGTQRFWTEAEARAFCAERKLRVV